MNLKNKSWSLLVLILLSSIGCKKDAASVAIEMKELVKKSQEITCSKTVECAQEQFSKLPESQKKFLPPMLQSKEACLESLTKSAAEARAKSGKTEEDEWKEATPEKLSAAKECMSLIEKTSCSELMSPNNPLQKSEACASLSKK
ncbi:hypothetical protein EHQ12_16970 [Leptospira gomenensis]|uniref:Lipoprotein n=1 Tax=Leptospira gomenensis TaxID=2484974 RepID=A0A5F1YYM0_9LEPT|nr:hypothetical protein [Leptospira gomenensis]TGK29514.1 hypothetical protein EHQ17_16210 [Leptospira gomenensis]TGK33912.1 hypothetical protein EHQ12_16970 [Leptospira gomenensis]TGK44824.1 hypothetical protein EHQ07_11080 [Leptospira gomenensis]TGK64443.1 hypothetical protein EHQ13_07160 [Leptospira gomenensis]